MSGIAARGVSGTAQILQKNCEIEIFVYFPKQIPDPRKYYKFVKIGQGRASSNNLLALAKGKGQGMAKQKQPSCLSRNNQVRGSGKGSLTNLNRRGKSLTNQRCQFIIIKLC